MNAAEALQIFRAKDLLAERDYHGGNFTCPLLYNQLNMLDSMDKEVKKDALYGNRVAYIVLADKFQKQMQNGIHNRKQIKPFLENVWCMPEKEAKKLADKLNEAKRVYNFFWQICDNISMCPNVDIRTLLFSEMQISIQSCRHRKMVSI